LVWVNSTRSVVTRSLRFLTREGWEPGFSGDYRFAMSSDNGLVGLLIAVYGMLIALCAWIVHMIRTTMRPSARVRRHLLMSGAHR
jgi:hypothetical protein